MTKFQKISRAVILTAVFLGAQVVNAQTEWLDESYRNANYPRGEWYVGFSQDRVTAGTSVADVTRRVERDAQNRLVESIAVRVTAESRSGLSSARTATGGRSRELVDRHYDQQVMASASAEITNAVTFSHHDAETNTVSAFIAVRRGDLADYYASQIEVGLVEVERLLELFAQQIALERRIEALGQLTEARTRIDALNYYRDLLVTVDTQRGLERSQGNRLNELIGRITAAQNKYERPKIVAIVSRGDLTDAQARIVISKFTEPFTSSNLYSVIARPDLFLQNRIRERVRRSGGSLNMNEVYKVAAENEAAYVCVIEINEALNGGYHVSARLVGAESGNVFGSPGQTEISTLEDIDYAANEIFKRIHINVGNLHDGNVMTDPRDGKIYRTVNIDGRVWMAENLNFASPNSWCYNDDDRNCRNFGRLYTWEAAMSACPGGYSLPRRREWDELVLHVGGWQVAGEKLKSKTHWNGTDEFGFSAVPAGGRGSTGGFALIGDNAFWWSATEVDRETAYGRGVESSTRIIGQGNNRKTSGFSVRCIQNEER